MGMAQPAQTGHGIHNRLRSRAFIFTEDVSDSNRSAENTICFVSVDTGMGSDIVTARVINRLQELIPEEICTIENTSISGTHTHSGPAGFLQYVLYQFTSLGWVEETTSTFVEGIAQSMHRAYSNLQPASVYSNSGLLYGSNINRSPTSYLENPQEERDRYADQGDTDKEMLLLKFVADDEDGKELGMLNWFAVHGTSMNNTNVLISGDNKGYASYLAERHFNGPDVLPGKGDFVAAFASTNLGDVSPNTDGAKCIDTGLPCEPYTSTCNDGNNMICIASGPGENMFESTQIIGEKQFDFALDLYKDATDKVNGGISSRHSFINMSKQDVKLENGDSAKTCDAALGYSFAAGTTDGPGSNKFQQGSTSGNPFWDWVKDFISEPTEEQQECQAPKPILLNTGDLTQPYLWDPITVPISVFQIGKLFILNTPCEFTTMAGRRLREAVRNILVDAGINDAMVTIAGLTNSYVHYVTTFEEYQAQRYEAASTLYGPHTLQAYVQNFERITHDLLNGEPSDTDAPPSDLSEEQISFLPPVILDRTGLFQKFGGVRKQPKGEYSPGEVVEVSFNSANPRNNQRIEDTYLTIDKLGADGNTWTTVFVDGDWNTKYVWELASETGISYAHITWTVPEKQETGQYRVCHYGTRKLPLEEGETLLSYAVRLFSWNGASYAAASLFQLSSYFNLSSPDVERGEYKDFMGCSKTFNVENVDSASAVSDWWISTSFKGSLWK